MKTGIFNNLRILISKILICQLTIFLFINIAFSFKVSAEEFYSINSIYGISLRVTSSICKDSNGFIWASSKTGILRLTDDDYRIYNLPYETSGAIFISLIYENSQLTAYTNNGQIFSYNTVYDRFELLANLRKFIDNKHFEISAILLDESDNYWIASDIGLYRYHSGNLSQIDKISSERCSITWYDGQNILVTEPSEFRLLNIHSLKSERIYENKSVYPFYISSLFNDKKQNKIWIGTFSNGLFCYDINTAKVTHILKSSLPRQPILAIEENSESTILIGVDGQGIWELNKNGNQILNVFKEDVDDPFSLHGNGVYDIYCDKGKRVWVCTISGGVSFFDQESPLINQIIHHANDDNSLVNNDVNGIIEDREGKIWFATNNGISCWNVKINQWKNFYSNKLEQAQVFLTLCEDNQGRIWAGSYSSGVYVLEGKTGKELAHYSQYEEGSPPVSSFIFDIIKDSQEDLWIGGVNGKFICYLSKENKFKTYTEEPISSFAELAPNQILVSCSYGILLLNKKTGEIQNLLTDIVAQDILVLGEEIWICSSGEGLLVYDYKNRTLNRFTTQEGLPSNFLNSIAYADNYLWIGTEKGLCRFDPKDKTTLTFSSIFLLSGISYNKSSICTLKNGKLALGTNKGLITFLPASLREIPSKGRIFFQDITISGRSIKDLTSFKLNTPIDSLKNINLQYFQNAFSLELLPIGISSGAKFSWILEGFDQEWCPPTSNRIITYTNIPSGKFKLKVKLLGSSLENVINERSIVIHLIPPFWRTGWFITLSIIFISGILVLYLLYYINTLKQKHTEEKVRFFTNTAHDIRTSLTLIKAPVEELNKEKSLTKKGKYYLHLAIEQARRLSFVVTQLMDFQKVDIGKEQMSFSETDIVSFISNRRIIYESFAESKSIRLLFNSNQESYVTAIDELKMEKIIDNLISNAVKYSHPNSQVKIDLKCSENKWVLQVQDYGIGISQKGQNKLFKEFYRSDNAINSKIVGSGIGLLLVKNYVTMHGGKISCNSQENIGSTFQVIIPFKSISNELKTIKFDANRKMIINDIKDLPQIMPNNNEISSHEMKILIVEDNENLLDFMLSVLSNNFKVITAVNGEIAWELISKQMPDLVISDIMMPRMDGLELCQLIKSTYDTSHIPVILLTALSEKTEQMHGLGLGADDYVTKPFDMNLLVQRIKTIIRNRKIIREKALKLLIEDSVEPIFSNELNDKFTKKLIKIAKANISNSTFNKNEFAECMNLSPSLLYKKVKSLTGQSPVDFIKSIRLNHALTLLKTKKYSVTEVSELCGFTSISYFSTVFSKFFGKPPTDILS